MNFFLIKVTILVFLKSETDFRGSASVLLFLIDMDRLSASPTQSLIRYAS